MDLTSKEYEQMNKKSSPNTKSYITIPSAFLVGGIICVIGQLLVYIYMNYGLDKIQAYTVTSVTLVLFSALLTGLKVYDNISKFAGAGTIVPITGFANAVVSPALEFKSEGYILGIGAKMFIIAGPVIVYGITASIIYGIILCLFNIF